jgi:hypothetical protein
MKKYLIAIAVLLAPLLLYFYGKHDPEIPGLFPPCPFHSLTGLFCPGCGSQRASHDLIHGDLLGGLSHNPLLIAVILVFAFEIGRYLILRFKHKPCRSLFTYPWFSKTLLIVVLSFWIARNLPWAPFQVLAP